MAHHQRALLELQGETKVGMGKRGCVHRTWFEPLAAWVCIKAPRVDAAVNTIPIERKFLEMLNQHSIGPQLLAGNDTRVVYKYVEGLGIVQYLKGCSATEALDVL